MLMQIDGTFIFVVISFLIFLVIIKAILFHPISKVLEERDNYYAKNSKMESESKQKSKALIEEKEQTLQQAKKEAGELIKNTSWEAKKQSEKKIKEAKKQAQEEIENNKQNLQKESHDAKCALRAEMNGIVKQIASKILSQDIEVNLEEEKINEYLKI
ncbi:MAG: hypothetical protein IJ003_02745 [Candidatus Gastranaerophilales bacterium]|nr:hypothetical protein [Candidatus Gastranaerophilales bacterium]